MAGPRWAGSAHLGPGRNEEALVVGYRHLLIMPAHRAVGRQ